MDVPRAFKPEQTKSTFITIDAKALHSIKDIAHKLDQEDFGSPMTRHHRIMFQALHDYLALRGAAPCFEVKL